MQTLSEAEIGKAFWARCEGLQRIAEKQMPREEFLRLCMEHGARAHRLRLRCIMTTERDIGWDSMVGRMEAMKRATIRFQKFWLTALRRIPSLKVN